MVFKERDLIREFIRPIAAVGWLPKQYREWTTRRDWEKDENDERNGEDRT